MGAREPRREAQKWLKRYKADLIDWERFRQVWYRRLCRPELPKLKPRALRVERARFVNAKSKVTPWLPYPWNEGPGSGPVHWDVFHAVQHEMRGTVYAGSASTMRSSWQRVLNALKRGEAWRYYPSRCSFKGHSRTADADHAR